MLLSLRLPPMPRTFTITIETDNPDGEAIVSEAARTIACQLDWGDQYTTGIEAVEEHPFPAQPTYIAGYEMEPGEAADA